MSENDAAPAPVKRSAEKAEGRRAKGPPKLRFHILQRLKFLLLVNTIPIAVGIFLVIGSYNGSVHVVGLDQEKHGLAAFIILGSCIFLGLSWWVIIPCAKWLRDYPRWFFRRDSKLLWFLPYTCGSLIWGVTWILCMLSGIVACVAMLSSVYAAFFLKAEAPSGPETAVEAAP